MENKSNGNSQSKKFVKLLTNVCNSGSDTNDYYIGDTNLQLANSSELGLAPPDSAVDTNVVRVVCLLSCVDLSIEPGSMFTFQTGTADFGGFQPN
jgi:hypothetical protein